MTAHEVITQYITIIHTAVQELHAAYPDQRIELHVKEYETNGWQCWIELSEHGIPLQKESFYINPPGV